MVKPSRGVLKRAGPWPVTMRHQYLDDVMQLTIFGASGKTGRQLAWQALAAGHHLTAVVWAIAGPSPRAPGVR